MRVFTQTALWMQHCKNLSPEYTKAAKSLAPLVPLYAMDCDDDKNKPVCSEQVLRPFFSAHNVQDRYSWPFCRVFEAFRQSRFVHQLKPGHRADIRIR